MPSAFTRPWTRRRRRLAAMAVVAALAGSAAPAGADQVGRDATFAGGGVLQVDFDGAIDQAEDLAVLPDGGTVVVGSATIAGDMDIVVMRLDPGGSPDPAFGDGGLVLLDSGANEAALAVAVQPDGRILVAGNLPGTEVVIRLLPDGELDPSFADEGVLTPLARDDHGTWVAAAGTVEDIVVDPSGRIVTVATAHAGPVREVDVAIARYQPDGTPDPGFGSEGRTVLDTGSTPEVRYADSARSLARLDDGSWAVVGRRSSHSIGSNGPLDTLVVLFTPWGAVDTAFGGTGWRVLDFGGVDEEVGALAHPGGRVLVGARVYGEGSTAALARLLPSGALDSAFGRGGVTRDGPRMDALARDGAGRILVAGFGPEYQVARYDADGALDLSFAGGRHRSDVDVSTEFPRPPAALASRWRATRSAEPSTPRSTPTACWSDRPATPGRCAGGGGVLITPPTRSARRRCHGCSAPRTPPPRDRRPRW